MKYLKSCGSVLVQFILALGLFRFTYEINSLIKSDTYPLLVKAITSPFTEEILRLISFFIYGNVTPFFYTIILAVGEFFLYIFNERNLTPHFVVLRFICMLMHFTCFSIQYYGIKTYRENNDFPLLFCCILMAITFHLYWNLIIGKIVMNLVYM